MGVVYNPPQDQLNFLQHEELHWEDLTIPAGEEFQEGEVVGKDANGNAIKLTNGTAVNFPALVAVGTGRHDSLESGKITVARGKNTVQTRVYLAGQTWTFGEEVVVVSDGANAGEGKGTLAPLSGVAAGTYKVIGEVVTPPAADGDWLVFEQLSDIRTVTKP
jgi:hypothetical protein